MNESSETIDGTKSYIPSCLLFSLAMYLQSKRHFNFFLRSENIFTGSCYLKTFSLVLFQTLTFCIPNKYRYKPVFVLAFKLPVAKDNLMS